MKRKTGIFGGTFDPIHIGHLIIAQTAYEQFSLDRMIMMPAGIPPHKLSRSGASNEQRAEMLRRVIEKNDDLELSLYEIQKPTRSYTYETLEYFSSLYPDDEFYFIMGADSLREFNTWMKPERICELTVILAAIRDNMDKKAFGELIDIRKGEFNADIRLLETPNIEISSSDIRNKVKNGVSIRYLVPDEVEDYIYQNKLYIC